ncbi:cytochrome b/b6 domain-containing protein [Vibrio sp. JC009]|uniref:cytochrome b n=1 Tax=Vibrio sp. JC009 TaxID=2912314 RepID=UPI0023B06DEF|nr:cytochrome b/b6 domain-containing protein [Vibrio sp. JC009]WED22932.1 cytochrome b/b6 domain-containing protein [Vibrio sp. JC009]
MKNQSKLSLLTISLHWVVGILMIASTGLGILVAEMAHNDERREVMNLHKSLGAIVLAIAVLRILWRWKEGEYEQLGIMSGWHVKGIKLLHVALLLATVVMPLSGLMISVGSGYPVFVFGYPLIAPGEKYELVKEMGYALHGAGMYGLTLGITAHVVGSVKYQLVDKYPVVTRMLGKSVNTND